MDRPVDHERPPWTTLMDRLKGPPWTRVDHPVKEAPNSAHMTLMSTLGKTLTCMSAAAIILTSATGCSDGINPVGVTVSEEEREAYEKARFLTPEGKAAADQELARIHGQAMTAATATPDVNDALMHPEDWPGLAEGKLCEYTTALIGTAHRDNTAVPERARLAADRILERC